MKIKTKAVCYAILLYNICNVMMILNIFSMKVQRKKCNEILISKNGGKCIKLPKEKNTDTRTQINMIIIIIGNSFCYFNCEVLRRSLQITELCAKNCIIFLLCLVLIDIFKPKQMFSCLNLIRKKISWLNTFKNLII